MVAMFGKKEENRFERIHQEVEHGKMRDVLKDRETGVLYLEISNMNGRGLVVLVDENGKPLVDDSVEEES